MESRPNHTGHHRPLRYPRRHQRNHRCHHDGGQGKVFSLPPPPQPSMTLYHGHPAVLASYYRADRTRLTTMVYGTTIPEQHLSYMVRLIRGHPTRVGLQLAPAFTT